MKKSIINKLLQYLNKTKTGIYGISEIYEIKEDKVDFLALERKPQKYIVYLFSILFLLLFSGGIYDYILPSILGDYGLIERIYMFSVGIILILIGLAFGYFGFWKGYFTHNKIIIDGKEKKAIIWTDGKIGDDHLKFSDISEIIFETKKGPRIFGIKIIEDVINLPYIITKDSAEIYLPVLKDKNKLEYLARKVSEITGAKVNEIRKI